jgi:hypothetical protein
MNLICQALIGRDDYNIIFDGILKKRNINEWGWWILIHLNSGILDLKNLLKVAK